MNIVWALKNSEYRKVKSSIVIKSVTHNIWIINSHWSLLPKSHCYKGDVMETAATYPVLWAEDRCMFKKMLVSKSEK